MTIPSLKARGLALLMFVTTAAIFISLRSRDFFSVDGSLRCLVVYRGQQLLFHPNNHMLYPANVLVWARLLAAVGLKAADPVQFVLLVALMNCLAAAGVLALLSFLIFRVTASWPLSLVVPLSLGLTVAFLSQATNANEPMVAVLWSLLGVFFAVQSAVRNKLWPAVVSGLLFALSLATYRSMVFLAPAAAVILLGAVPADSLRELLQKVPVRRLLAFFTSFAIACAVIFVWAYNKQGIALSRMPVHFLQQEDSRAYLGFNAVRVLNAIFGLARNCFPILPGFVGFRKLLGGPKFPLALVTSLCAALILSFFLCGYELFRRRKELSSIEKVAALASAAGLLFTIIPVLIWEPHYGKLWLQPLICLSFLVAIAVNRSIQRGGWVSAASIGAGVLFFLGVTYNLSWAIPERDYKPYEFEQLTELEHFIGSQDFVVGDWNSLSLLYGFLDANSGRMMSFVDEAVTHGTGAVTELDQSVARTRAQGGKIYFVGLLDLPKPTWDSFLYQRCGVKYEELHRYRQAARFKAKWAARGGQIQLWEVDPAALPASSSNP